MSLKWGGEILVGALYLLDELWACSILLSVAMLFHVMHPCDLLACFIAACRPGA